MSRVISGLAQFFDGEGGPLSDGWLKFLVSGTNNTLKDTYADIDQTIPNANPVQLDAEGRVPNIFGQGYYKVIMYENNPVTGLPGAVVKTVDPVISDFTSVADGTIGNFAEWDSETVYQVAQIVIFNAKYYRSIAGGNLNNQPDTNPDDWEEVDFLRDWNTNVSYLTDDVVVYSGAMYFSLADSNQGNQPDISPTWWDPVGSGTILLNWEESGTTFRPILTGYDFGDSGHAIGTAYINNFGSFPLTPSALPTTDYQVANKIYIDTLDALNMKWSGPWVPGTYNEFDVVTDDGWLMIANTTTEDRPAPQPVGDSGWTRDIIGETPFSEGNVTESVMYIGQRYTFTTAFFISNVRVWIPANATGINVELWAVRDPTGANKRFINLFPGFNVDADETDKWLELPVGNRFIPDGEIADIFMVLRPGTGGTQFTYQWDYSYANGDPLPGDIHHQRGTNIDQIRIHEQDTSLIDRSADLDNLGPGSVFTMASSGYTWEVLSVSKTGDVYTLIVDPGARADDATSNFTFTYFGAIPVYYVYNTNFFSGESRIQGYFGNEYDPINASYLNQDGYGLDIKVQASTSSDDWDVMSESSTGSAGGGGDATTLSGYYAEEFAIKANNETISGDWTFTGDQNFTGDLTHNGFNVYSEENGPLDYQNPVINSSFDVWQRGKTFTFSGGYTADRWYSSGSGSNITIARQSFTIGQTDVPGNPKYYPRVTPAAVEDNWYIGQFMEDVTRYSGEEVTYSVYLRAGSAVTATMRIRQDFGSGGSAAVDHDELKSLTTSWQRFTFTTTLTSTSGKTVGSNDALSLYVIQTASSSVYIECYGFMINKGPVALPYRREELGDNLRRCQRYYQKSYEWDVDPGSVTAVGDTFSANKTDSNYGVSHFVTLPVVMRKQPTWYYWDNEGNASRVRAGGTPNVAITDGTIQVSDCFIGFDLTVSPYVNTKLALHYVLDAEY